MKAVSMTLHAGAVMNQHTCVGLVWDCLRTHRSSEAQAACSHCTCMDDADELVAGVIAAWLSCRRGCSVAPPQVAIQQPIDRSSGTSLRPS